MNFCFSLLQDLRFSETDIDSFFCLILVEIDHKLYGTQNKQNEKQNKVIFFICFNIL
jgi:hypothetical protein